MVRTAIDISNELFDDIDVWSVPFIKPISHSIVEKICYNSEAIVVLEEHSKYGGLGSLISEIASASCPVKILQIAVDDCFSEKCGTYDYLLQEHGLDFIMAYKKIRSFLLGI
jgi:transketolase